MNVSDILPEGQAAENTLLPDISSSITDLVAPFMWFSVVLTVVFIGLYLYSMMRRRRLENALFDIQKNIAEMNARDKARTVTPPPSPQPRIQSPAESVIARNEPPHPEV